MGKKSKKSNAAKAKPGASVASGTSSASVVTSGLGGTGGIPLTSAGTGGGKKQRCADCLALLKDLSKAHPCPGCSLLFCWRCEKKRFLECPNKDQCVNPLRRCRICAAGGTMERELIAAGILSAEPAEEQKLPDHEKASYRYCKYRWGIVWSRRNRTLFEGIINEREDLTDWSIPVIGCGNVNCQNDATIECHVCADSPKAATRLSSCCRCAKTRCRVCLDTALEVTVDCAANLRHFPCSANPDGFAYCRTCSRQSCYGCLDGNEIARFGEALHEVVRKGVPDGRSLLCCSHCYWSAKPCTNPTCPNEVGVPTKRCGGCHLDRYCSVECQAAAYPGHVGRCKKIQEKRAAAGM